MKKTFAFSFKSYNAFDNGLISNFLPLQRNPIISKANSFLRPFAKYNVATSLTNHRKTKTLHTTNNFTT